ncbi:MAG: ParB/RepB/Spo0J family partition protein [Syntrophobacteraceae bacterium]
MDKKRGLGRGLEELLATSDWLKRDDIQLFYCPVERLIPNPYQPRQSPETADLEELVKSIKEKGVLQPILVTRTDVPEQYQILAGERRWQASKLAGLADVPVIVREATSAEVLELALIENVQRRDLNCIEEAIAYQRLQTEFSLTQDQIAQRVGKNRATVANTLRLLQLPEQLQADVLNGQLTMGHARALLSVEDPAEQQRIRDAILARHLSVRQTEQLVATRSAPPPEPRPSDPRYQELESSLGTHFDAPVRIRGRGNRGSITIAFESRDQLERLISRLGLSH